MIDLITMICKFQRVGTIDCSRFSSDSISVAIQDLCTYDIIVRYFRDNLGEHISIAKTIFYNKLYMCTKQELRIGGSRA